MKKVLFSVFLISLINLGQAQIFENLDFDDSPFHAGFDIYVNSTNMQIINDGSASQALEAQFRELEVPIFSFSAHIFTEFDINRRSKLSAGIGYQRTGVRNNDQMIYLFNLSLFPMPADIVYVHHNIEIPIKYKFYYLDRFYVLGGVSLTINLFNDQVIIIKNVNGEEEKFYESDTSTIYRELNYSANLGLGFDYVVHDDYSMYVQLFGQHALKGIAQNSSLNEVPFSFGLSTGIRF